MKYWGKRELRRLWERRLAGEDTTTIAEDAGIHHNTLRRHWRVHLGVDVRSVHTNERRASSKVPGVRLYTLRSQGLSYRQIAEQEGVEDPSSRRTIVDLQNILGKYCKRIGVQPPKVERVGLPQLCSRCGAPGHNRRSCR